MTKVRKGRSLPHPQIIPYPGFPQKQTFDDTQVLMLEVTSEELK